MHVLQSISARMIVAITLVTAGSCGVLAAFSMWQQQGIVDTALQRELKNDYANITAALSAETGYSLFSASAYRSYDTQISTYDGWVADYGQAEADRFSARPGHSEHQTGLAMDLGASSCGCTDEPFGSTPEGIWVAANAWRFGYIVRYPDGYEAVTGYIWEPWHVRYVGLAIAQAMHDGGIATLEDYYGTGPAPNYG